MDEKIGKVLLIVMVVVFAAVFLFPVFQGILNLGSDVPAQIETFKNDLNEAGQSKVVIQKEVAVYEKGAQSFACNHYPAFAAAA